MNLKIGARVKQVSVVIGKGGKVEGLGGPRSWLSQGEVQDSSYVLN